MKTQITIIFILLLSSNINAQCIDYVNIPDTMFKSNLLSNTNINTDGDDEISCDEATSYDGIIYAGYKSISNLTGIEAFVNITGLNCAGNSFINIDVTNNTLLTSLSCGDNNNLSSIDISQNTALISLSCRDNNLSSLNISNNTYLTSLDCSQNNLSSLDISLNTALTFLDCGFNNLTNLNITENTNLISLRCPNNPFLSLNLSNNISLENLDCDYNNLTNLDLTNNINLITLFCGDSAFLTSLNLRNGNNINIEAFNGLWLRNNPNLTCIEVDDEDFSTEQWSVDDIASFSEDCNYTLSADNNAFENSIKIYPNPTKGILTIQIKDELKTIELFNTTGHKILSSKLNYLNISELSSGVYILKLITERGEIFNKSIIKE